jgi:hypothetical protein
MIDQSQKDKATEILSLLKAAYPNSYKDMNRRDADKVISMWATMLSDIPGEISLIAVQQLIAVCKFPPTIAEVREKVNGIKREVETILYERSSRISIERSLERENIDEGYSKRELQAQVISGILKYYKPEIPFLVMTEIAANGNTVELPQVQKNLIPETTLKKGGISEPPRSSNYARRPRAPERISKSYQEGCVYACDVGDMG